MPRIVRSGLIQASVVDEPTQDLQKLKKRMIDKHMALIDEAASMGAQVLCLQELFYGPYFPAEQDSRWYEMVEPVPEGPTTRLMQDVARRHQMVMVVPVYEEEMAGIYYNTAAVIDADGTYLGKYRKTHLPHLPPGFWEKFYFRPGNSGYPVFSTKIGQVGVYICYDRHFPEGARALGLNGAEIVFKPLCYGGGPLRASVAAGAAGPCGGQRLLRRRHQPGGTREALGHRRVLRKQLLLRPLWPHHHPGR